MTKCPKCGAYIPDGGKMCIACGWKPEENDMFADNPIFTTFQNVMDSIGDKEENLEELADKLNLDKDRWIAAASYIGPAFLYTYFAKSKDSELIKYHANQACLVFIFDVVTNTFKKLPIIGKPLKKLGGITAFAFAFQGARKAVAGEMEPVPFIGEMGVTLLK